MRQIVLPGDTISETKEKLPHTYVENGKTYSLITGTYDKSTRRIVPLEGVWSPQQGDIVIGIISYLGRKGVYKLSLSYFLEGMILEKYPRFPMVVGDIVEAEVERVENHRTIILTMPRLLKGGTIITVGPTKVHRVIGKANTMIKQISELTKCTLVVGENGVIWIKGERTELAAAAIFEVERAAHVSGLTEVIRNMLIEKGK